MFSIVMSINRALYNTCYGKGAQTSVLPGATRGLDPAMGVRVSRATSNM